MSNNKKNTKMNDLSKLSYSDLLKLNKTYLLLLNECFTTDNHLMLCNIKKELKNRNTFNSNVEKYKNFI